MRRATALIRIRFPFDLVDRLDQLADQLRVGTRRRIPRAALVRALVQLRVGDIGADELEPMLGADPVKRGRAKTAGKTPRSRHGASALVERRTRQRWSSPAPASAAAAS